MLPVLLGLLPILSAIHFLMAPASIANAMTLGAKQEELSQAQVSSIETQLDRASAVVAASDDLEQLRKQLEAIPGIKVTPAPKASLDQARKDIREALLEERRRVRTQIGTNAALARDQFARRSVQNAGLAVTVGLLLGWMRFGAMKEMELSTTYLSWVVLSDSQAPNLRGLKNLLDFQNACLATSYLGLVERLLRPTRVEEPNQEDIPDQVWESMGLDEPAPVSDAPWEAGSPRLQTIKTLNWKRSAGMFKGRLEVGAPISYDTGDPNPTGEPPPPSRRDLRRSERDRERVREALQGFSQMMSDTLTSDDDLPELPRRRRPSDRQLRKAREALERFAEQIQAQMGTDVPELQGPEDWPDPLDPRDIKAPTGSEAPAYGALKGAERGFSRSPEQGTDAQGPGAPITEEPDPYARRRYRARTEPVARPNPLRVLVHWVLTHL